MMARITPAMTVFLKFVRIAATCLSPTNVLAIHFTECTINNPEFNFEPRQQLFERPHYEFRLHFIFSLRFATRSNSV